MFDELKKIAGVHTGATPIKSGTSNLRLKITAPIAPIAKPAAPVVVSHPLAPVIRTNAIINPIAPVQRATPAPAPAPMPKIAANAPPPPPSLHIKNTGPIALIKPAAPAPTALLNLAAAAGVAAPTNQNFVEEAPRVIPSATAPSSSTPSASSPGGAFLRTDRAPSSAASSSSNLAGADDDARGFERVERSARPKPAAGMPPSQSNDTRGGTLKGRSTMAGYKGTGEITYCPINSNGLVAASQQLTLPGVRPSKPFQGQRLLIDHTTGAAFQIVDIKLGNEPVAVTAGAVDGGCFPPENGPKFEWKVADGVDIIFTVANKLTASTAFTAMLVGEVCVAA